MAYGGRFCKTFLGVTEVEAVDVYEDLFGEVERRDLLNLSYKLKEGDN